MGGLSFPHGYYSGEWQKSPIPFGFSGGVNESVIDNNLLGGTNTLDGAVCPNTEFWVATNLAVRYIGTTAGVNLLTAIYTTVQSRLTNIQTPTSNLMYSWQGFWVCPPGGLFRLVITGATAGNGAFIEWVGFKVDLGK